MQQHFSSDRCCAEICNPTPNPNPSPTPTPKPTNTRGCIIWQGAEFGTTPGHVRCAIVCLSSGQIRRYIAMGQNVWFWQIKNPQEFCLSRPPSEAKSQVVLCWKCLWFHPRVAYCIKAITNERQKPFAVH